MLDKISVALAKNAREIAASQKELDESQDKGEAIPHLPRCLVLEFGGHSSRCRNLEQSVVSDGQPPLDFPRVGKLHIFLRCRLRLHFLARSPPNQLLKFLLQQETSAVLGTREVVPFSFRLHVCFHGDNDIAAKRRFSGL